MVCAKRRLEDRRETNREFHVSEAIVIISPELPPTIGGLADYTAHFVRHWARVNNLRFIVPEKSNAVASLDGYPILAIENSTAALLESLPREAGKVLVQYSAYGFHPYGYPRWLIKALLDWKNKTGSRLALMFHEIWTFWPWWNKNFLVQNFHRRAIGRLASTADAVLTTTTSQAKYLADVTHRNDIIVLPVGANILPDKEKTEPRIRGTAALFGMQAARCKALRLMRSGLAELARAGRLTAISTFGAGRTERGDNEEKQVLLELGLTSGFKQLGAIPARDASHVLATAEFGIAAQDKLSYEKSTTFMSYAAHGLKILSCFADATAPVPMSLLSSPEEVARGLPEDELERRATRLHDWYHHTASWPRIAAEFARALDIKIP
jgi:hypothetical protein